MYAAHIHLANDEKGLNLGMRNITVSTCGLVPYIHRFSVDFPQVNLAVSLEERVGSQGLGLGKRDRKAREVAFGEALAKRSCQAVMSL